MGEGVSGSGVLRRASRVGKIGCLMTVRDDEIPLYLLLDGWLGC